MATAGNINIKINATLASREMTLDEKLGFLLKYSKNSLSIIADNWTGSPPRFIGTYTESDGIGKPEQRITVDKDTFSGVVDALYRAVLAIRGY